MIEPESLPSPRPRFSAQARLRSFIYAGRCLQSLVQDEHNAWLHLAATVIVTGSAITLKVTLQDWRWLVAAVAFVWIAEAINTAIEELCDLISPEFNPYIGRVKDLAAGGVLIASLAAGAIGLLTLGPPLISLLS